MIDPPDDWESWCRLKPESVATFLETYPHPFLLRGPTRPGTNERPVFTTVREVGDEGAEAPVDLRRARIYAVAKTSRNPFADKVFIGRASNCDIHLRDVSVSKLHASLRVLGPMELEVVDLNSVNGTLVNNVKLLRDAPHRSQVGDTLSFGFVTLDVISAAQLYTML